jgi:two-component system, OmpR family, phosphate regulon sensor histidine kinase PhoR
VTVSVDGRPAARRLIGFAVGGLIALVVVSTAVAATLGVGRSPRVLVLGLATWAVLAGSATILAGRWVARALVAPLRDLRLAQARHAELRTRAREVGIRIRDHLAVTDVLAETVAALGPLLDTEALYVRLVHDGLLVPVGEWRPGPARSRISVPPEGSSWPPEGPRAAGAAPALVAVPVDAAVERYSALTAVCVTDLDAPGVDLPSADREVLRALRASSVLFTSFGVGAELLGELVVVRGPGAPAWSETETEMVEWVAADLGRGLHQARLYSQQRQVADELRALHQARNSFLSTVSHELRTPLTSISGYVEMLREGDAGEITAPQDKMLETVERNATRLRSLIEDLLTLSQIEMGAFKTVKQPVDLRERVSMAASAIQPAAFSGGLSIQLETAPESLVVDGDTKALDRVLMNLLSNAVKFTPSGGRVTVRTRIADGQVVLTVSDTGIGIPADEQKALFTRWFRASNATEASVPGTGLGLSIVRTVVANHEGDMEIHSQEGAGTTVIVRLPLHREVAFVVDR